MNQLTQEPEAYKYQLEIKDIWTPNLAIAKYSTNLNKPKRFNIIGGNDEDDEIEYNQTLDELVTLKEYLNNMLLDPEDCVIFFHQIIYKILLNLAI